MSRQVSDADLIFLELDTKYSVWPEPARPHRDEVLALVAEVREWRELGPSPQYVADRIEVLERNLLVAESQLINFQVDE